MDKRNLVKKLKEIEAQGLLKSQFRGNLKLYSINKNYGLYKEYKKIILTTVGLEGKLREILKNIKGVREAYLYGSFAKEKQEAHSDIDLLIIGNHDLLELQKKIRKLQNEISREVNVVNMDEKELTKRIKNKDPFILNVLGKKHVKLVP